MSLQMHMENPVIKVTNLTKEYKELRAVDGLSFEVYPGEIHGFLGQNGAGKSTTIRMLLSLIKPSSGSIEIFGKSLETNRSEILSKIGAVIERPDLYKYLTAYENLRLFARLSGLKPDQDQLMYQLTQVGLEKRAHSKVRTFSQGMKQRLGLAVALIHNPDLIILDEPTNGLDPQGIADIRNLILKLCKKEGKTILVSSHLLSEIELIADRMIIIDKGKKVVEGAVKELFDPSKMIVNVELENPAEMLTVLQSSIWAENITEVTGTGFVLQIDKNQIPGFSSFIINEGGRLISLQPKYSLEDYFLSLTSANQHVDRFTN
ncbi:MULTISPECIES: ABC transporter ATP-binding protein [unclassified Paraflavitalea]|uniref:ABC transporter ATP-binding protein n=1 Tax=unclassified Paraflavitalea TaxID=2798305 RepID=UPI003D32F8F7